MLVQTTKGEMDEALLQKKTGTIDNENETINWVEYWLEDELVHRSVDMILKKYDVSGLPVAASF
jgi:hypothetical protein